MAFEGNKIHISTPQAALYGGVPGGANAATDEALARTGSNDAAQIAIDNGVTYQQNQARNGRNPAQMDAAAANNQASGAGGNQAGAIELARRQAMGAAPSAAAYQMQAGLNQASAQQRAMAAGARGSAALATAGANRNANISNLQQNAFSGAGMLRSREMAEGRGLYGSATNQQRGQDQQMLGMANDFGTANVGAQDSYKLGMGNAAVGLGGVQNAQQGRDFTNERNAWDAIYAQDDANQDRQNWLANNRKQAVAANIEDAND